MTIFLDLPASLEARVQAEAERQQKTPAELVAQLVEDALPTSDDIARRKRSVALLESLSEIGDEDEQKETFAYLSEAVDTDRLSDRKCFS